MYMLPTAYVLRLKYTVLPWWNLENVYEYVNYSRSVTEIMLLQHHSMNQNANIA